MTVCLTVVPRALDVSWTPFRSLRFRDRRISPTIKPTVATLRSADKIWDIRGQASAEFAGGQASAEFAGGQASAGSLGESPQTAVQSVSCPTLASCAAIKSSVTISAVARICGCRATAKIRKNPGPTRRKWCDHGVLALPASCTQTPSFGRRHFLSCRQPQRRTFESV